MNKLEVGMYIRINGDISKIEKLHTSKKGQTYMQFKQPNGMLTDLNIKFYDGKASHYIIDLIEVGDYVNGLIVNDIVTEFDGTKTFNLFKQVSYFGNEDINRIVTKEQFKSMEYSID